MVDRLTYSIFLFISYGVLPCFLASESVKNSLDGFLTDLTDYPAQVA